MKKIIFSILTVITMHSQAAHISVTVDGSVYQCSLDGVATKPSACSCVEEGGCISMYGRVTTSRLARYCNAPLIDLYRICNMERLVNNSCQ